MVDGTLPGQKKQGQANTAFKEGKEAFGIKGDRIKQGKQNIPDALYYFSKAIANDPCKYRDADYDFELTDGVSVTVEQ